MKDTFLKKLSCGVFDYHFLVEALKKYADPRGKISRLLKNGDIIRVKKGLYAVGEEYRQQAISRPLLANLIYGPSYVSGLYALSFYGLIPEKVLVVTSMTVKKTKFFKTPFGMFEYQLLKKSRFDVGLTLKEVSKDCFVLFASPEKALADVLLKEGDLRSLKALKEFLFENLRIDESEFVALDENRLEAISIAYESPLIHNLLKLLKSLKNE